MNMCSLVCGIYDGKYGYDGNPENHSMLKQRNSWLEFKAQLYNHWLCQNFNDKLIGNRHMQELYQFCYALVINFNGVMLCNVL